MHSEVKSESVIVSVVSDCNPRDCNPPGSSIHGILQASILEWVAMLSSRGSSQPRDRTCVSCLLYWQVGSIPLIPSGKPNFFNKLRGLKCYKLIPHRFPGSGTEAPFSQSHQADIKVLAGVRISSQAWCSFPGPLAGGRTGFLPSLGNFHQSFATFPHSYFPTLHGKISTGESLCF